MVDKADFKQKYELTPGDFERHPAWVGVHNYDYGQPWHEGTDEDTYRPWNDAPRFTGRSGFLLLAATIELADGSMFPGCIGRVADSWDEPLPPRKMRDGNYTPAKQWSKLYGDTPLSILLMQHPQIFIDGQMFQFRLVSRGLTKPEQVRRFYAAVNKKPGEVFPVGFSAEPALADGIVSGRLDGFYSGGLRKPFEVTTGEEFLNEDGTVCATA
ncbi:MAG TPA: hypothetical protein VIJ79_01120 [Acidobacteriaceae bacterium]